MKLRFAICDDESYFVGKLSEQVKKVISKCGESLELLQFKDGSELSAYCKTNSLDAALVDIDMPFLDGFSAVKELQKYRENTAIIFITNHDDKVFQSYEYQPFWFIRKSHMELLDEILCKLVEKAKQSRNKSEMISIITEDCNMDIDCFEVIYLQASKHYIDIYNANGKILKSIRAKMHDLYGQIEPYGFVLVQLGIAINCRYIEKMTSRVAILKNHMEIPLSRNLIEEARNKFLEYMRSKRW